MHISTSFVLFNISISFVVAVYSFTLLGSENGHIIYRCRCPSALQSSFLWHFVYLPSRIFDVMIVLFHFHLVNILYSSIF